MMKTIHKFGLPLEDEVFITFPDGGRVLHVGEQHNALCVWVEVDTNAPSNKHRFCVRGTGHPLTGDEGDHVGTVQMKSGLVFHVYHTPN